MNFKMWVSCKFFSKSSFCSTGIQINKIFVDRAKFFIASLGASYEIHEIRPDNIWVYGNLSKNMNYEFQDLIFVESFSSYSILSLGDGQYPRHGNFPREIFRRSRFPLSSTEGIILQPVKYYISSESGSNPRQLEQTVIKTNFQPW